METRTHSDLVYVKNVEMSACRKYESGFQSRSPIRSTSQPAVISAKLTIETLEQSMKYVPS